VATALPIRAAGFQINAIERGYMTGPKPWTFRVGDELIKSLGHADLSRLQVPAGLFDRTSGKPIEIAASARAF
jgi:hypothetical protein